MERHGFCRNRVWKAKGRGVASGPPALRPCLWVGTAGEQAPQWREQGASVGSCSPFSSQKLAAPRLLVQRGSLTLWPCLGRATFGIYPPLGAGLSSSDLVSHVRAQLLFLVWLSSLGDFSCSPPLQVQKLRSTGVQGFAHGAELGANPGRPPPCPRLVPGVWSCAVRQERTDVFSAPRAFALSCAFAACETEGFGFSDGPEMSPGCRRPAETCF